MSDDSATETEKSCPHDPDQSAAEVKAPQSAEPLFAPTKHNPDHWVWLFDNRGRLGR